MHGGSLIGPGKGSGRTRGEVWPHLYDDQGRCKFSCPVPEKYVPPNENYANSRPRCCDCRTHPRCGLRCNVVTYYVVEVNPTYFAWWEQEEARP